MSDETMIERLRKQITSLLGLRDLWKRRAEERADRLAVWRTRALAAEARNLPGSYRWPERVERWRSLVTAEFNRQAQRRAGRDATGEEIDLALGVMYHESGGDHLAICGVEWIGNEPPGYDPEDPGTRASGLFQMVPAYWPGRCKAAGFEGASVFDPVANIGTAGFLAFGNRGWCHWTAQHVGRFGGYEKACRDLGVQPRKCV